MAGVQTAVELRGQGWRGGITLLGDEPHPPYDRPPLSKAVLLGAPGSDPVDVRFDVDFGALDVELRLGERAETLRAETHELVTDRGTVPYDRLVLATGAYALELPGTECLPGVHPLRTLDDAVALRPVLEARQRVVVVGAGWIGAEFATAARQAGCEVTVVEAAPRPLAGVLPASVTAHMRDWYDEAGVELRTGTPVAALEPGVVVLADGSRLAAGAVVVGIGARPATRWLAGSAVALDPAGAVLADDRLRTTAEHVYAVGDCASVPSARYGRRLLIHHWDNAMQGPRTAAANVNGGDEQYDPVPYFWSEQFGRFVQYAGHHSEDDTMVTRGDPAGPAWSVLWLRDGLLVALLAVGRPRDMAQARKLITRSAALDPVAAADPAVPLKSVAR
ncbi:NADPH-dependent 2,4-dienoyl-CoA reductase, sulfur reductase [Streptomyces sp. DvalAA-14]|uniref:NAD(P)/FAD-dependent oxidoreductase n=1 Tax=unclassified Streptomyces TaxID=2593676 RepID=UPI00081AEE36|nr:MULTISPECIES: FAD-dependent oxidoreductase [unclassified Streptomyces]MYS22194.1 FAD-dependent oxidoreductase [Streptomyces sp. SID4948]SCE10804.1 NADPH-dependent 2,4-dienoyl-CoA reductase, sulfur reductase [Streptomyces sp. DvalAA-14]